MRTLTYLVPICFLFFSACQSSSSGTETESQESETVEAPPQWMELVGNANGKNVVLVSGDEEYRSEEALPQLARILNTHHGMNCKVLFAQDPEKPGVVNPNYLHNIPGLESLADADLMILFTRFRALPDQQMQFIEDYLKSGKPVIGIRTSTHAFRFKDKEHAWRHYGNFYEGEEKPEWKDGFGRLVLGEKWISHHGHHKHQSTVGIVADGAAEHPIMTSISDGDIWGPTDVYGVRLPLPGDSQPLVLGQVTNRKGEFDQDDLNYGMRPTDDEVATKNSAKEDDEGNPNDPMMPVAWVKSYQVPGGSTGKTFAATIGASTDMQSEGTRRMYVNAVYWCLDLPVPENAKVDVVGKFDLTPYQFQDDEYWESRNLTVADIIALGN